MPNPTYARSRATVFNEIAGEYDRHRPGYPDALVDQACKLAGIGPGASVLEIGCGTGKLTRSLLARGLRVTAVDPGDQLLAVARDQLQGLGDVEFFQARLEDATLPLAHFQAVFCASAIHWVDPDVSWQRTAAALVDGGTLALMSYFGLEEPRSAPDQQALRAAIAEVAPALAAVLPTFRDLDGTLAGVEARRDNVSEVWSWLGSYDLGRADAASLFHDVQVAAVPTLLEHTGEELHAVLATLSFWSYLPAAQRDALAAEARALHQRLGRPIRSSTVACLVTARRQPRA